MASEVKLDQLDSVLSEFEYPISRDEAISQTEDITLILAEGTENLGEIISQTSDDRFVSADDLETEVMNFLPRHSVGEPYQSEGEG
ncbi:DUF5789 family protein [Natrinema gelatinilyticum]|uniref:DUF5789 family protein n=1 Tax=Natrinema gelatinilyticum TaxID=2961571 RepID=UPI0020C55F2D|nr:hypothetical protein [Natrinema gelatinilyticum]